MAASKDIGKLVVKLQMDLDGLRSDVQKSNAMMKKASQDWQSQMKSAATSVATVFKGSFLSGAVQEAISVVTNGIRSMFDEFDRLADSADKLNTTTETLQEIGFAASQTGVDLGQAEQALAKLQVNLGKIGTGDGKAAAEALKQLGLSANQLRSLSMGDQLAAIGEALKGLPDQTSRMAAATALLGKGAAELLPLVTQFATLREQARSLGVIIDEQTVRAAGALADQTAILKLQGSALLAEVLRPMLPVLSQTTTEMIGTAESAGKMGTGMAGAKSNAAQLGEALASLITWADKAGNALDDAFAATVAHGASVREALQQGAGRLTGREGAVVAEQAAAKAAADAEEAQKRQKEFADRWARETLAQLNRETAARQEAARVKAEGEEANKRAAQQAAAEKAAREAATAAAKAQKEAEAALQKQREDTRAMTQQAIDDEDKLRLAREESVRALTDAQALVMGATQQQIDLQNAANDGYSQEIEFNKQRADAHRQLASSLDEWARFAKAAFDEQTGGLQKTKEALDSLTAAYNTGRISLDEYNAGMKEVQDQTNKLTDEQQQWAQVLGTGFADIFTAIATGAEDAEDAVKRLLIQLVALAAQKAAMKFVDSMFASAKGNAFGPNGLEPFAQGGIVMSPTRFAFAGGRMGVMGEAGPEAVLPLSRGSNGKLGVAANGGGMNLTIINNAGVSVTPTQDDPSNMRITIDQMTSAMAAQVARGGNAFSAAMERAYGVRR